MAGACGGSNGPRLGDRQVERWVTVVDHYAGAHAGATCYLLTRSQLRADVAHPDGRWAIFAQTFDQTNGGSFFGPPSTQCSIIEGSTTQLTGPGLAEVGLADQFIKGSEYGAPYREVQLPGTSWYLTYTAWDRRRPSSSEMQRVEARCHGEPCRAPAGASADANLRGADRDLPGVTLMARCRGEPGSRFPAQEIESDQSRAERLVPMSVTAAGVVRSGAGW